MRGLIAFILIFTAAVCFADEYSDTAQAAMKTGVDRDLASGLAAKTKARGYSQQSMQKIQSFFSEQFGSSSIRISEKIMEGIAKNVPEARVIAAAAAVRTRYAAADRITDTAKLSQKAEDRATDIIASALTAGATQKNLEKTAQSIAAKKQERDLYALAVFSLYREMVRYGVSDAKAEDVSQKAINNMSPQQISDYRNAFMKSAGSMNADSMASEMAANMSRGYGAGSMSGGMSGSGGGMGGASGSSGSSGGMGGGMGGHGSGGHR